MDTTVSLAPGLPEVWSLTDCLGRRVGQIRRRTENEFVITTADPGPDGPLSKIDAIQPLLNAAMDSTANHLKEVCQHAGDGDG